MNKIKITVLIAIIVVLASGCTQAPKQEPMPASIPKLKIMSVTAGQATLSQIPMVIKVKNIGNATAKDVYVGGTNVFFIPKNGNFTNRMDLVNKTIFQLMTIGHSYIDTGIPNPDYNSSLDIYSMKPGISDIKNLSAGADFPENPDYIGDILPGEVKEGHITLIVRTTFFDTIYTKIAWTDDKKEYAIY